MITKTTRKKTKVVGKQAYINPITGELVEMYVSTIEERDCNFEKIWLGHIAQALDIIGNKKMKVVTYIMQNRTNDNLFTKTQMEIEQESGVSRKTVHKTLKALQEADFTAKIHSGLYRVNPDVIFKGTRNNRMNILLMYKDESNQNKKTEEEKPPQSELIKQRIKELQEQLENLMQEEAKLNVQEEAKKAS